MVNVQLFAYNIKRILLFEHFRPARPPLPATTIAVEVVRRSGGKEVRLIGGKEAYC